MSDVKTLASGVITLDAEAIKAFASLFDPQPYHLDQQAADKSICGSLCASGLARLQPCPRDLRGKPCRQRA